MVRIRRAGLSLFIGVVILSLVCAGQASSTAAQSVPWGRSDAVASTSPSTVASDRIAAHPVAQPAVTPNCRYGVSASPGEEGWLASLGAGWYLDFRAHRPAAGIAAEFVQMVRVRQAKSGCVYLDGYVTSPPLTETGLGAVIKAHLGATWIIGNEPDRGPNPENCLGPGQDDTFPEIYARAYHDAYHFIKSRDATARVATAGLVEVTPGRLQYLDRVWEAYLDRYGEPMPVDIWNMHLYVLPEARPDGRPNGIANVALGTDPALAIRESYGTTTMCTDPKVYCYAEHDDLVAFAEQVVAMRTWMKRHGQQGKPLILSEYSILYPFEDYDDPNHPSTCYLQDEFGGCFTQARVSDFMVRTFDYLESAADPDLGLPVDGYRLVQRWLWYAMYTTGLGSVSSLITAEPAALTQQGLLFRQNVASRGAQVNLRPGSIPPAAMLASARPVTATVAVQLYNTGTVSNSLPFTVTFYADSALTQPFGSVSVSPGLEGCACREATATTTWPGLAVGSHRFWVVVDSGDAVHESDESDNVASGVVTIYPHGAYAPLIVRRR